MQAPRALAAAAFLCLFGCVGRDASGEAEDSWRTLEQKARAFEESDRRAPPPRGAVFFIGSSSIEYWRTLHDDFPGLTVVRRGLGGTTLREWIGLLPRFVLPHAPKQIVVYAGDNDIANGLSPGRVEGDFRELTEAIRAALPDAKVHFLSIKPSASRWQLIGEMREANERIRRYAERTPGVAYVDVASAMLAADGRPRPELFAEDQLHLSPAGYALWTEKLLPLLR